MSRMHLNLILGLVLAALLAATAAWDSDVDRVRDLQVKAAMLLKIPTYVVWPERSFEGAEAPFVVGIIGNNPFEDMLDHAVEGQTVSGRAIEVRLFRSIDRSETSRASLRECHLLWVSESEKQQLKRLQSILSKAPVLTISEFQEFAKSAGMVELYHKPDGKIGFRINRAEAEKSELKISAQLLKLATIVDTQQ